MRLILRTLGTWLLSIAVILGVIDGTKSLAANAVITTSLGDLWTSLNATSLEWVQAFLETRFFGPVLTPMLASLLTVPSFVVVGVPAIVLAFLGRSRYVRQYVKTDEI
ncbi:hypothetical protein GCM10011321_29040 [Youhaiella tibetensis]|nr:hypothetical protein XM25_21155 [Devosia sp. H5989]GGF36283.1 hypothetical protein GCM10011321_29040 [Youhaiella tibetensis]